MSRTNLDRRLVTAAGEVVARRKFVTGYVAANRDIARERIKATIDRVLRARA